MEQNHQQRQPMANVNDINQRFEEARREPSDNSYHPKPSENMEPKREKRIKLVAYGGRAAFQFEQSQTKDGVSTVGIESAPKLNPNDHNDKRYKWDEKTTFQITFEELPILVAVLLGFTKSIRFDNHGSDNKFFEIENQGKNFFMKLGGAKGLKVAPVSVIEGYHFGMLALNEYTKNFPDISTDTALIGIRLMLKQLNENGLLKLPQTRQ